MNEAMRSLRKAALGGLLAGVATLTAGGVLAQDFRDRPPEDEVIYFLLPDRFANGDPSNDRAAPRVIGWPPAMTRPTRASILVVT